MIWFNFIFGIAIFASIRTLLADWAYIHTIRQTAAVAMMSEVAETMKDNPHFKRSVHKAHEEYTRTLQLWLPLTVGAILALAAGWVEGYQNSWLLSETMIGFLTIATVPVYARPWTHPTDVAWLTQWASGLKAVIIANEYTKTKSRLDELAALPEDEITPVLFVEFQALAVKMKQLEELIGTLPEPQKSEQTE